MKSKSTAENNEPWSSGLTNIKGIPKLIFGLTAIVEYAGVPMPFTTEPYNATQSLAISEFLSRTKEIGQLTECSIVCFDYSDLTPEPVKVAEFHTTDPEALIGWVRDITMTTLQTMNGDIN